MSDLAQQEKLIAATRMAAAATLTSALVTAAGRAHSIDEAMELYRDVYFSLFAEPSSGNYQTWLKNKRTDQRHS